MRTHDGWRWAIALTATIQGCGGDVQHTASGGPAVTADGGAGRGDAASGAGGARTGSGGSPGGAGATEPDASATEDSGSGGRATRDASVMDGAAGSQHSADASRETGTDASRTDASPTDPTDCLLAELAKDVAAGVTSIGVEQNCANGEFCCGYAFPACVSSFDVSPRDGGSAGLVITPDGSLVRIALRGVFDTADPLPLIPTYPHCGIDADSSRGAVREVELDFTLDRSAVAPAATVLTLDVGGWEPEDIRNVGTTDCFLNDPSRSIPSLSRILEDWVRVNLCGRCGCR